MIELTEIMRQRDDIPFSTALNSLRTRVVKQPLSEETNSILNECIREGPDDALHVYSTNDEVNDYNLEMLKKPVKTLLRLTPKTLLKIDRQVNYS